MELSGGARILGILHIHWFVYLIQELEDECERWTSGVEMGKALASNYEMTLHTDHYPLSNQEKILEPGGLFYRRIRPRTAARYTLAKRGLNGKAYRHY